MITSPAILKSLSGHLFAFAVIYIFFLLFISLYLIMAPHFTLNHGKRSYTIHVSNY